MNRRMSGMKLAVLIAVVMLVVGVVLVGASVVTAGPGQVVRWLEMPVYVSHDDGGWQVSTRENHASPEKQGWESDAEAVNGLLLHLVDADMTLRAVEGLDQVRLTWYETYEGEYQVELKDGILQLGHRELDGGVIGVQFSASWEDEDIPAFWLEYPADKEWLSAMLVGVDAEFVTEGRFLSRSTSLNLADAEGRLDVQGGNFSVVGMDYDLTAALDCQEVTLDGMDVEARLTLAGEAGDHSFSGEWMDAQVTLNGRRLREDDMGKGARKVTIDCMDAEVDIVTMAR